MTNTECIEILEKMQFCEHTDFAHDITFGFGYSDEYKALDHAINVLKQRLSQEEIKVFDDLIAEWELRAKYNIDVRDYKTYSLLIKIRERIIQWQQEKS